MSLDFETLAYTFSLSSRCNSGEPLLKKIKILNDSLDGISITGAHQISNNNDLWGRIGYYLDGRDIREEVYSNNGTFECEIGLKLSGEEIL